MGGGGGGEEEEEEEERERERESPDHCPLQQKKLELHNCSLDRESMLNVMEKEEAGFGKTA